MTVFKLLSTKRTVFIFFLSVVTAILTNLASYKIGDMIQFAVDKDFNQFIFTGLLTILLYVIGNSFNYIRAIIKEKFIQKNSTTLRDVSIKEFKKEYITNDNFNNGAKFVNMSISDIQYTEQYFNDIFMMIIAFINIIVISIFFIRLNIIILFFVIFLAILMIIVPKLFQKKLENITELVSNEMEVFNRDLENHIGSAELLKNTNSFSLLENVVGQGSKNISTKKISRTKFAAKYNFFIVNLNVLNQIFLMAFAGYLAYLGKIEVGMVFSIVSLSGNFFSSLMDGLAVFPSYAYLKALLDKYNEASYNDDLEVGKDFTLTNKISFKNVIYNYENKSISYPNLNIIKNKKYVIIGDSGSGKSTLVNILNGNYKNYVGDILWDSNNVKDLNFSSIKNNIATMSQNVNILNGSIKYNIILNKKFDKEKFEKVIEKVKLKAIIESLPNKEETILNSSSLSISGGQAQRIALARALYQDTPVIILDEGTSSLDIETSNEIEKILFEDKNLTVIMITHHFNDNILPLTDKIIKI